MLFKILKSIMCKKKFLKIYIFEKEKNKTKMGKRIIS